MGTYNAQKPESSGEDLSLDRPTRITLRKLKQRRNKGVTCEDVPNGWRTGEYVRRLREKGYDILTIRESHRRGLARYVYMGENCNG